MIDNLISINKTLHGMDSILSGCDKGMPEEQIPHFLCSYDVESTTKRDMILNFCDALQDKSYEHRKLGLNRRLSTYSLFIDRDMKRAELDYELQRSQDIANVSGLNHYSGYMLVFFGDIFEASELKDNLIIEYLSFNVFLRHRDVRAVFVVSERIREKMHVVLSHRLPSPVVYCMGLYDNDENVADTDIEELFKLIKRTADRIGMQTVSTSERFMNDLYMAMPREFRNEEEVDKMMCHLAIIGYDLSIKNVEDYVNEVSKLEGINLKQEIGFRI